MAIEGVQMTEDESLQEYNEAQKFVTDNEVPFRGSLKALLISSISTSECRGQTKFTETSAW